MGIATRWKEIPDSRWSIAQVRAKTDAVAKVLVSSRRFVEVEMRGKEPPYMIDSELMVPMIVYSRHDSTWSFIEGLYGVIGNGWQLVSSALETDVLLASFDDSTGCSGLSHYSEGRLCLEYMEGPSEFFHPRSDCFDGRSSDGVERNWLTNAHFTRRRYSEADSDCDIDNANFLDVFEEATERLGLSVPYLCWGHYPEPSRIAVEDSDGAIETNSARLFDTYWG